MSLLSLFISDPEHFAFFITPLLKDIIKKIEKVHYSLSPASSSQTSLSLYSCHDINLYGLLTLFGVSRVVDPALNELTIDNYDSVWPYYGSSLCMEISTDETDRKTGRSETYITLYWDEKPVEVNLSRIERLNDISPPTFDASSRSTVASSAPSDSSSGSSGSSGSKGASTITLSQLKDLYSYLLGVKNSSDLAKNASPGKLASMSA